jgi:hypothetical protein
LQHCSLGGKAVDRAEICVGTFSRGRNARLQIRPPTKLHQRTRLDLTKQLAPVLVRKRSADRRLLLDELIPDLVVVGDDIESRRQSKIRAVALEQPDAEGVDGAEKNAVEGRQHFN